MLVASGNANVSLRAPPFTGWGALLRLGCRLQPQKQPHPVAPVVVHGKSYPSKAAAMRDLGLTWKAVTALSQV